MEEKTPGQQTEIDVLLSTSKIIYERDRLGQLQGRIQNRIVYFVSLLLAATSIVIIYLLQYDEYFVYINQTYDKNQTKRFCDSSKAYQIDLISTPIAAALILFYILIYKRRVFLRNKFKYKNIGLPMIVSCWNKV